MDNGYLIGDGLAGTQERDALESPRQPDRVLASYAQFRTNDREVAQAETARLLSPHHHRIELASSDRLDATVSFASLGTASLYYLNYNSAASFDRPSQNEYISVLAPQTGRLFARHQKQEFVSRAMGSPVVVSGGDSVHMEWSDDCSVISLRAETAALAETMRNLAPDLDDRPLRFAASVEEPRASTALAGTLGLMTAVLDSYGSVEAIPSKLRRHLREQALVTILLSVPHNMTSRLLSPRAKISRRAVRDAIGIIESETMAEFTIPDIAKSVGVGMRALEFGFQQELQCTPRTYIQRVRMQRAHSDLQNADQREGTTVTQIAQLWGFAHTGRFASAYRQRFGLSPSQTLRQSPA